MQPLYTRLDPPPSIQSFINEFWIVENPGQAPTVQKVIPDGYPEIIIHYGDPYRIKLLDKWEDQAFALFSGQISRYFFLENTGKTAMLGIKLMPHSPAALFNIDMVQYTDRVLPLRYIISNLLPEALLIPDISVDRRIEFASEWMCEVAGGNSVDERISNVIEEIKGSHGMSGIEVLAGVDGASLRHLEREFKRLIGLTPKCYSRIVQFNYIFEAMKRQDTGWVDVALNSGYFDQSHFIANFKAFSGESPAEYGFDEENLANFFLKRQNVAFFLSMFKTV